MFDFSMNNSWKAVDTVMRHRVLSYANGVTKMRKNWEKNKKWVVKRLCDQTARREIQVKSAVYSEDVVFEARNRAYAHFHTRLGSDDYSTALRQKFYQLMCTYTGEELVQNLISIQANDKTQQVKLGSHFRKNFLDHSENVADLAATALSKATEYLKLNTVKAQLVLSANPLDMVMASEHTTGWRSCYNLHGGFQTAPQALLMDDCTLMAYAYDSTAVYDPLSDELPKKLWRILIHMTPEQLVIPKEYPTDIPVLTDQAVDLCQQVLGVQLTETERTWDTPLHRRNVWHYNDGVHRTFTADTFTKGVFLRTGSSCIYCVRCGSVRRKVDAGTMLCDDCRKVYGVCTSCGRSLNSFDHYVRGDEFLCLICLRRRENV